MSKQPYSIKQSDVLHNANSRWNFLVGAVRSGKTFVANDLCVKRLTTIPGQPRAVIGKSENTISRNIVEPMQERFGNKKVSGLKGRPTRMDIFGVPFYVLGAYNRGSVENLKGLSLQYAYGDEITTWPQNFFEMLKSRLEKPDAKFDGTTNPEGPNHWLKAEVLDSEETDLYNKHFTLDDNPYLDPDFVDSLKREYTGVWYARYIEGKWVKAEGLVYDMFDEEEHLVSELPEMKKFWVGTDYGTANPTHFNLLGLGKDNRFYLIDEWRHSGAKSGRSKTDVEYSQHLQDWLDGYKDVFSNFVPQWIFIDPSAKSFITQVNQDTSFRVSKADNTVLDGIRKVGKLLGTDNLKIHKRCESTIGEFHAYSWDDNAQGKGEDKPLKEDDHSMDSLRYIVNSIGKQYQYVLRS